MIYKKVLGIFKALPLESIKVKFICELINSSKEEIMPILEQLKKEGNIKGKVKFKLNGKYLDIAKTRLPLYKSK